MKDTAHKGPARVYYADIGDYLSREDKLDRLRDEGSFSDTIWNVIPRNDSGDWINQRDERFSAWPSIGDKASKGSDATKALFRDFALGVSTNRDAWVYSFGADRLRRNIATMADELAALIQNPSEEPDPRRIGWSRGFESRRRTGKPLDLSVGRPRVALYRPFVKQVLWFDTAMIDSPGISRLTFPSDAHVTTAIAVSTKGSGPMMIGRIPSLDLNGLAQVFPRYTWEPASAPDGALNFDALAASDTDEIVDGYRRVDNITDATLSAYREEHGDVVTKDDIFYGIYALLHHPTYRETYAADLQKILPRIPQVKGFLEYARIGRALADLHVDYESVDQHSLGEELSLTAPEDPYQRYRIDKLSWISRKDHTGIRYNEHLTITGIPDLESEYKVGGRSPLEWVIDRYKVTTDKKSGIVNDPNAWLREQKNPRYVVDLIRSLVTVSLETQRLIAALPPFDVIEADD